MSHVNSLGEVGRTHGEMVCLLSESNVPFPLMTR